MKSSLLLAQLLTAATCWAGALKKRDTVTAQVNFSNNTGTPQHLASGVLYGVPNTENQIPPTLYTDMGYNYNRAGGAQLPSPALGWIWGLTDYENRFASALSNYQTAREYGATFILLLSDLWGVDGTQNSSAPFPGDDGDWTSCDEFLDTVISDINSNSMTDSLVIDIWNEPDGSSFWVPSQSQYLEYWGRAYYKLRDAFGTDVLLSGPSTAGEPLASDTWWEAWASFVGTNDSIPDQYVWHIESGTGDLLSAQAGLFYWQSTYGLAQTTININEYSIYEEQVPAGSAWFIAQLERIDAHGLRGNWLSGYELHDFLASLLSKPGADTSDYSPTGTGYFPNGDYQVYKYYNQNMTGYRVGTLPSEDLKLDAYATVGEDGYARVLVGVRITEGTWELQLNDLSSLGLATSGTLDVHTWGFPVNSSNTYYGEVDGPTDLGWVEHTYSDNTLTFPVYQTDTTTAYAFEFAV